MNIHLDNPSFCLFHISLFHRQRQRRSDILISRDLNLRKRWLGNNHFGWQTIRDAGNLAISRARDFRRRTFVTMRRTTDRTVSCKKESLQSRKSSQSTANVISISSSECDGSCHELSSRQSSRSNQILTVTDGHGIIERSELQNLYHMWKHIFGPRLTFTCKNMIKIDVSEKILICHIYRWTCTVNAMAKANVNLVH